MNNYNLRFENPMNNRYYRVLISQDLFSQWIVTKIWGGIGKAGGRVVHTPCPTFDDAIKLIDEISKNRHRRGYLLKVNSM